MKSYIIGLIANNIINIIVLGYLNLFIFEKFNMEN